MPEQATRIHLIPAAESDRDFFRSAHHTAYRDVIEAMFGWDEAEQDDHANREFDLYPLNMIMWSDQKAGVIGWQKKPDHFWLNSVFILPDYQNKGIGSYVIKNHIAQAAQENLPVKLRTLRLNLNAQRLYEKLGFQVIKATDIHWHMEYRNDDKPV